MTILKVRVNTDQSVTLVDSHNDTSNFRDAVEVQPKPTITISQMAIPSYDFSTIPVNITYSIIELSIQEIQNKLTGQIKNNFRTSAYAIVNTNINDISIPFDGTVITAEKIKAQAKINEVNAATTLDELSAIVL